MSEKRNHVFFFSLAFLNFFANLGAVICSFWVIYRIYFQYGLLYSVGSFFALSLIYKFGVAPLFAISASVLCFKFGVVGTWLPITSYIIAAITLAISLGTAHKV